MTDCFSDNIKKVFLGLLFLFISGLLIWSCNKHGDLPEPAVELSMEKDFVTMLSDMNSLQVAVDAALPYLNNGFNCGNSTLPVPIGTNGGEFFTINFAGSTCSDNIQRSGTLNVYYSGIYSYKSFKDTIRFQGFKINDRTISGYRIRTTLDSIPNIKTFSIFDSITTTIPQTDTIKFPFGRTYKMISRTTRVDNSTNPIITSTIYGSSSGSIIGGDKFSVLISPAPVTGVPTHLVSFPLRFETCSTNTFRYPVSGALTFTNISLNLSRTINFETWKAKDTWEISPCTRDTATYISPLGNIYYSTLR